MKVFVVWDCEAIAGIFDSLEKAKDCIVKILINRGWKEEDIDFNNFEEYSTEYFSRGYLDFDFQISEYSLNEIDPHGIS